MEDEGGYIDDFMMAFSDDDSGGIDMDESNGSTDAAPNCVDFMTSLLENSQSTVKKSGTRMKKKQVVDSASNDEDMKSVLARMKQMEKELSQLREQVAKKDATISAPSPNRTNGERLINSAPRKGAMRCKEIHQTTRVQPRSGSITAKSSGGEGRNLASKIISQRKEDNLAGIVTERYSGLRIRNPLISSEAMTQRMTGRKMIRIKKIASSVKKDGDIDGDWVIIGVIVDKLPPRDTVKGKKYTIWKLSDLSGQSAVVSLFLFGEAFQSHWKTSLGTVIAILNPQLMPNKETGMKQQSAGISTNNPKTVMIIGDSQDYTTCKGVKGGKRCGNFASLSDGGYCDYHICSAYSYTRSQRMEFQNGYGPSASKGKLKEKLFRNSKAEIYYYGGETFTAPKSHSSRNDVSKTSRLFAPGAESAANKVFTEKKQTIDGVSGGSVGTHKPSELFSQLLQTQCQGAKVFSNHQKRKELAKKVDSKTEEKSASKILKYHQSSLPVLGRGSRPGTHVDLLSPPNKSQSLAKLKAIHLVKRKGPIDPTSPSTCMHSQSSSDLDIMKRVQTNRSAAKQGGNEVSGSDSAEPMPKRQRRTAEEIEQILNIKSSHEWVNEETEMKQQEEYFSRLEKKENIDLKRSSVTELRVTAVSCKTCKYTAEYPAELCTKENHQLIRFKVLKKAFSCKKCNEKCYTYDSRRPVGACKKCGETTFESASLYHERKTPALPTENLLIRGIEEKFLK